LPDIKECLGVKEISTNHIKKILARIKKSKSTELAKLKIDKSKLIFDGYPRNISQAQNLNNLLEKYDQKIDLVLELSVSLNTIKKRILERQIQEKRADDKEEIAIKRYETYEKNIRPVIDFYKQSNLLKVVKGEASISEINVEISDLIEAIKGWL